MRHVEAPPLHHARKGSGGSPPSTSGSGPSSARGFVAEVEAAAALGDRSENAEYIYGKKKLRELDRRLRFLVRADGRADGRRSAARTRTAARTSAPGSRSRGRTARSATYRLVGPDELESPPALISVDAPLGRALLGKAEGDVALVQRPSGAAEVTVLQVTWSAPERPRGRR